MKHSIADLFHILMGDIRALVGQEFLLVKTEMSEKVSRLRGHLLALALGGSAACAGLIVLLMGLGLLLAWAFTIAGLPPLLAGFVGLAVIGLLVCGGGGWLAFKAIHALSKESLVPEKSIEALEHLAKFQSRSHSAELHENRQDQSKSQPEAKLSSDELKNVALATEGALNKTLDELAAKFSPRRIVHRMKRWVTEHPARMGAATLSLAAGVAGLLFLRRKFRHG